MISPDNIPYKKIPYLVEIIIYKNDRKDYDENLNDTNRMISKYIESVELHEKIHCFIYRLLRIPSMILYVFRYSSFFIGKGALCMPIKSLNKFQTFFADILHFLWDLCSDLFKPELNQIQTRNPKNLFQKFFKDLLYWDHCEELFDFQSISEIKGFVYQMSDEIVEEWEKGIALF